MRRPGPFIHEGDPGSEPSPSSVRTSLSHPYARQCPRRRRRGRTGPSTLRWRPISGSPLRASPARGAARVGQRSRPLPRLGPTPLHDSPNSTPQSRTPTWTRGRGVCDQTRSGRQTLNSQIVFCWVDVEPNESVPSFLFCPEFLWSYREGLGTGEAGNPTKKGVPPATTKSNP